MFYEVHRVVSRQDCSIHQPSPVLPTTEPGEYTAIDELFRKSFFVILCFCNMQILLFPSQISLAYQMISHPEHDGYFDLNY